MHEDLKAINELIINNQKIAFFTVEEILEKNPFRNQYYDDCIGVANEALCLAAHSYNPEYAAFSHWAYTCIKRALMKYLLKERRRGLTKTKKGSMPNVVYLEDSHYDLRYPETAASCSAVELIEAKDDLDRIRDVATDAEMRVAELVADGYSYESIGRILFREPGAAKTAMCALRKKARKVV